MTFSSIPTTFPNTKLMLRKYFSDSALMDCLLMQTNVSSMTLPANTSDTCCLMKASPWPLTRSKLSKIGRNPGKSKTSSLSYDSPTSIIVSFSDTLKSPFCLRVLPTRVPLGTLQMSAVQPLKHLKRLSPQLRSLPIGFWTLKSPLKQTHPITHSPLYFQLQIQMANCTRLHSTPKHFPPWNSTTMFMTKSYSQFLKPSNVGDIILKALHSRSTWSPITGICNTFQ